MYPEVLQAHPALAVTIATVLGLLVGSFLNVVIYRLPRMLEAEWEQQAAELRGESVQAIERFNLLVPRSRCPGCARPIAAHENIPVLSYLALRGRCAGCGIRIPPRYPLVEALTGALFGLAVWHFGWTPAAGGAMLVTMALIAMAFIDLDTQLLPDSLTLPLLWAGLLFNLWGVFVPLESAVIGAMAGYLSLWSVYWVFRLVTGKEGMGFGDFKLLAALGAWFGWQALPVIILLSSLVGAAVGLSLMLFRGHRREVPIPFGPYLAGAGLLALFVGRPIGNWMGFAV
ncbi:MAG: prepilin peptidase [Burkholderiales bacterium]|nr:MAG: prepilin peptidase [Burkholderiales bacterium]